MTTSPAPITTLAISGMSCGHCVRAVEAALAATPDVTVRRVGIGSADLVLAPGATADTAIAAVGEAGYEARVAEPRPVEPRPAPAAAAPAQG